MQDNAATVRTIYDAFNRQDFEACMAQATEDMVVELIAMGQTFRGRPGFKEFMAVFKQAFPDLVVTVRNQVSGGNQVVSECGWKGTHAGPLQSPQGEIPPTGKAAEARFCEVWDFRDGKVAAIRNYQDAATWLRQLGLA